jgi:hypothetical protein
MERRPSKATVPVRIRSGIEENPNGINVPELCRPVKRAKVMIVSGLRVTPNVFESDIYEGRMLVEHRFQESGFTRYREMMNGCNYGHLVGIFARLRPCAGPDHGNLHVSFTLIKGGQ